MGIYGIAIKPFRFEKVYGRQERGRIGRGFGGERKEKQGEGGGIGRPGKDAAGRAKKKCQRNRNDEQEGEEVGR